jgi:hypothetical protein
VAKVGLSLTISLFKQNQGIRSYLNSTNWEDKVCTDRDEEDAPVATHNKLPVFETTNVVPAFSIEHSV